VTDVRMDRVSLISGLFYGMEGMRIGGTRRLRIPPSFAFGETGIADCIRPNAVIIAEVSVLACA
jgi:FKBP-type peptidyl-prolyl cis-trans isomerase FkpA